MMRVMDIGNNDDDADADAGRIWRFLDDGRQGAKSKDCSCLTGAAMKCEGGKGFIGE